MTNKQRNHYAKLINEGKGKDALDEMLHQGMSRKEIYAFYESINFYPNEETADYITRHAIAKAEREALDILNRSFGDWFKK